MTITFNTETITVKELIEQLQKLPEDYKVKLHIKYQNIGDYGDRWSNMWINDIDCVESDDNEKTVTIKAYD